MPPQPSVLAASSQLASCHRSTPVFETGTLGCLPRSPIIPLYIVLIGGTTPVYHTHHRAYTTSRISGPVISFSLCTRRETLDTTPEIQIPRTKQRGEFPDKKKEPRASHGVKASSKKARIILTSIYFRRHNFAVTIRHRTCRMPLPFPQMALAPALLAGPAQLQRTQGAFSFRGGGPHGYPPSTMRANGGGNNNRSGEPPIREVVGAGAVGILAGESCIRFCRGACPVNSESMHLDLCCVCRRDSCCCQQ